MGDSKVTPKKEAKVWRPVFLEALADTGNVSKSCEIADIARQSAYRHKSKFSGFSDDWEVALKIGMSTLEDEAVRRARDGVDEGIYYQGDVVGHVRKYSDTLLIFLLKAHKPEKYRDTFHHEMTGKDGGPLGPTIVMLPAVEGEQ